MPVVPIHAVGKAAGAVVGRPLFARVRLCSPVSAGGLSRTGEKGWVITEWGRSATTILLPSGAP